MDKSQLFKECQKSLLCAKEWLNYCPSRELCSSQEQTDKTHSALAAGTVLSWWFIIKLSKRKDLKDAGDLSKTEKKTHWTRKLPHIKIQAIFVFFQFQKIQSKFTSYSKTCEQQQQQKGCDFGFELGQNHYWTPKQMSWISCQTSQFNPTVLRGKDISPYWWEARAQGKYGTEPQS